MTPNGVKPLIAMGATHGKKNKQAPAFGRKYVNRDEDGSPKAKNVNISK
tara:strand:- start:52620 stop:52766 length:147 start_codon:yes stop_codon:yes gene_type:complete